MALAGKTRVMHIVRPATLVLLLMQAFFTGGCALMLKEAMNSRTQLPGGGSNGDALADDPGDHTTHDGHQSAERIGNNEGDGANITSVTGLGEGTLAGLSQGWQPLHKSDRTKPGDVIRTGLGGQIEMDFGPSGTARVLPGSMARIEKSAAGAMQLVLLYGKAEASGNVQVLGEGRDARVGQGFVWAPMQDDRRESFRALRGTQGGSAPSPAATTTGPIPGPAVMPTDRYVPPSF